MRHLVESNKELECDATIDTPTLMVKLDATSNMYHHFCDFFNIYMSLNLNGSIVPEPDGRQVLILDNHPYHSSFRPAWKSVTDKPLWDLNSVAGKRICFRDLLLPLLPRMVYGLYYGTPLIPGCHSSSMFSAFSAWFSTALDLSPPSPQPPVRLTLLSRSTKYRQILNEQEIVEALRGEGYQVSVAKFTPLVPFREQLQTVANTDILVRIWFANNNSTLRLGLQKRFVFFAGRNPRCGSHPSPFPARLGACCRAVQLRGPRLLQGGHENEN